MSESTAVAIQTAPPSSAAISVWQSPASFEAAQRMAKALVSSNMVPESYRDNIGNALIALDISQRVGASPLMVMQNLHIISGRPSWGSSFIIAALNSCGKFSPIRFKIEDRGERTVEFTEWTGPKGQREKVKKTVKIRDKACVAYAVEKATGEVLDGPEVSVAMAVAEGWYTKSDSKWPTMTDLMLRYRAAAFFGRLYAPDLLMGMSTEDEARDILDAEYTVVTAPAAPAPATEAEKPAARPKGVHAAMKAAPASGKARKAVEAPADGVTREYDLQGEDQSAPEPEDADYEDASESSDDDVI